MTMTQIMKVRAHEKLIMHGTVDRAGELTKMGRLAAGLGAEPEHAALLWYGRCVRSYGWCNNHPCYFGNRKKSRNTTPRWRCSFSTQCAASSGMVGPPNEKQGLTKTRTEVGQKVCDLSNIRYDKAVSSRNWGEVPQCFGRLGLYQGWERKCKVGSAQFKADIIADEESFWAVHISEWPWWMDIRVRTLIMIIIISDESQTSVHRCARQEWCECRQQVVKLEQIWELMFAWYGSKIAQWMVYTNTHPSICPVLSSASSWLPHSALRKIDPRAARLKSWSPEEMDGWEEIVGRSSPPFSEDPAVQKAWIRPLPGVPKDRLSLKKG